jgi:hypothetical protein
VAALPSHTQEEQYHDARAKNALKGRRGSLLNSAVALRQGAVMKVVQTLTEHERGAVGSSALLRGTLHTLSERGADCELQAYTMTHQQTTK